MFFNRIPTTYYGAGIDYRPVGEKMRDFQADEIAMGAAIQYEDNIDNFPFYEVRDQKRGNTCVAQSYAKARAIQVAKRTGEYLPLSSAYLYKRRANAPAAGMAMHDVLEVGSKYGTPPEMMHRHQGATDEEIARIVEHPALDDYARVVAGEDQYIYLQNKYDSVALQVQTQPVILFIYATLDEWRRVVPVAQERVALHTAPVRHAVCALATVVLDNKHGILIDDSWGVTNSVVESDNERDLRADGQRFLTRDFIDQRVYAAATFIPKFNFEQGEVTIRHYFGIDIEYGDNNQEVVALQLVLQELGFFPKEQRCTGAFYGITLRAVQKFQEAYNIVQKDGGGYGRVGPKTRAKLNEITGKQ